MNILGFGGAIVDYVCHVSDDFLNQALKKFANEDNGIGSMNLIDKNAHDELIDMLSKITSLQAKILSGGSVANSIDTASKTGADSTFSSYVGSDDFGKKIIDDFKNANVKTSSIKLSNTLPTSKSIILVDKSGERTMFTYIGASGLFNSTDIDEQQIKDCQIAYIEGYMAFADDNRAAITKVAELASKHNKKLALTLASDFCASLNKDYFKKIVKQAGDNSVLFGNLAEYSAFLDCEKDINKVADALKQQGYKTCFITDGSNGSYYFENAQLSKNFAAKKIDKVVNTTGAGDSFAGVVLAGLLKQGKISDDYMKQASDTAAKIVAQEGARL